MECNFKYVLNTFFLNSDFNGKSVQYFIMQYFVHKDKVMDIKVNKNSL